MRKQIVAGNWKMNMLKENAKGLVGAVKKQIPQSIFTDVDVVLVPPYTVIHEVRNCISGTSFAVGAQDVFYEEHGAYTGEIAPPMLVDAGCTYVIIGHSERRQYFAETDETVNRKVKASLACGLNVIVCVGETLEEREGGKTFLRVETQLTGGFQEIDAQSFSNIIIAYEPIWAIGTGRTATPEAANEVHAFIRGFLTRKYGVQIAKSTRIQYGGSVKPENALELFSQPDIDGGLIGGASLKAESFVSIVEAAAKATKI